MTKFTEIPIRDRPFEKEITYKTSRSQGPGGQHVNKTETRVDLLFHIEESNLLSENEKRKLVKKLAYKINSDGFLIVSAQEYRSQVMNKNLVLKRFQKLLEANLKPVKKRIATRPTLASKNKRLKIKKRRGEKKALRNKPQQ